MLPWRRIYSTSDSPEKTNKPVKSGKRRRNYKQNNIYFNWSKQQVLTGSAAGLGSEDFRWAIIACSRSLSFFNCVRWEDRNRSWESVNSRLALNDEITFSVGFWHPEKCNYLKTSLLFLALVWNNTTTVTVRVESRKLLLFLFPTVPKKGLDIPQWLSYI